MAKRAALKQSHASIRANVHRSESCIMDRPPLGSRDVVAFAKPRERFSRTRMTPRSADGDSKFDDAPEHKPAGDDEVAAQDAEPNPGEWR
jgi:hypothetical protein